MGYADPETIRMLCCVSKQFYDIITNDPGMENNRVIPLLQISPSEQEGNDFGRLERLLNKLDQNQNRSQLIREVKVINGEKFYYSNWKELARLMAYGNISTTIHRTSSIRSVFTYQDGVYEILYFNGPSNNVTEFTGN